MNEMELYDRMPPRVRRAIRESPCGIHAWEIVVMVQKLGFHALDPKNEPLMLECVASLENEYRKWHRQMLEGKL